MSQDSGTRETCGSIPMTEPSLLRRAIRTSTELARAGHPEQALTVIDHSLAESIRERRTDWIRLLTANGVILCDKTGDLKRAKEYCEQCLLHVPDDPWTLYRLARVMFRLGEFDVAKREAARAYNLARRSTDKEVVGLLKLLTQKWPEVSSSGDSTERERWDEGDDEGTKGTA